MSTQPWPPPPNNTSEWYKQTWFTVVSLLFCFPVGLVLMWMYQKKWNIVVKSIVSGLFAIAVIANANSPSTPVNPGSPSNSTVSAPLTPAQKRQAAKAAKEQAAQAKVTARHQKEADAKAAAQAKRQEAENERQQAEEARQQEKTDRQQAEYDQTHYKNDGLTLDTRSVQWGRDDSGFGSYITGKVTNDSGDSLDYAEITYKELDEEGNQIGTARDNITHLDAGATWKFKCMVLEDGTKHVHLDELKSTPL